LTLEYAYDILSKYESIRRFFVAFNERHNEIIKILNNLKNVTVQSLTERLKVSEVTIRKDLTYLEEQGKILRTHGGAVLAEEEEKFLDFSRRVDENILEKQAIARNAKLLIRENDTIYIDAGSTCLFLADEIKEMNLRVLTNSLDAMVILSKCPQISLFSLGGYLRSSADSFIGPIAEETIKNFQIETCFLGTSGISKDGVFSSQNIIESQLKKTVLDVSRRKVVLSDYTKYNVTAFSIFAKPENIDILITDSKFPDPEYLRTLGMEVVLSTPD
jgi:DeoR/GlpR family transcriptional regulator of sugar metabolism